MNYFFVWLNLVLFLLVDYGSTSDANTAACEASFSREQSYDVNGIGNIDQDILGLQEPYRTFLANGGYGAISNVTYANCNFGLKCPLSSEDSVLTEFTLLEELQAPFILKVYRMVGTCFAMKLYARDLQDYNNIIIFLQLAQAFLFIHSKGYIHWDVRPANVFMTKDTHEPALADFGMMTEETSMTTPVPLPWYSGYEYHKTRAHDVYGFGQILKSLFGMLDDEIKQQYYDHRRDDLEISRLEWHNYAMRYEAYATGLPYCSIHDRVASIPLGFVDLIDNTTHYIASKRPTFEAIHEELLRLRDTSGARKPFVPEPPVPSLSLEEVVAHFNQHELIYEDGKVMTPVAVPVIAFHRLKFHLFEGIIYRRIADGAVFQADLEGYSVHVYMTESPILGFLTIPRQTLAIPERRRVRQKKMKLVAASSVQMNLKNPHYEHCLIYSDL